VGPRLPCVGGGALCDFHRRVGSGLAFRCVGLGVSRIGRLSSGVLL